MSPFEYHSGSREIDRGDGRSREDAGLVLQFAVDLLGDHPLDYYTSEKLMRLEVALTLIPLPREVPRKFSTNLFDRYTYALNCEDRKLERVSATRLRNVYHQSLNAFFKWAKKNEFFSGDLYNFDLVGQDNAKAKNRDAWKDEELLKLFSLPLFVGCQSRERYWVSGDCLVQNEIYWAFIITFFMGMRASEIGQLRADDFILIDRMWFVELKNVTDGPIAHQRQLKTPAANRRMPLPRLLIELGILELKDRMQKAGSIRLFPNWTIYENKKSGRLMFGHHFSKSWQYIKTRFGFTREGLTLHGGRHTRAGWYDEAGLPQRIRNRLMGHASTCVADSYGPMKITTGEAERALSNERPIVSQIAEILIDAKLAAMLGKLRELPSLPPKKATK